MTVFPKLQVVMGTYFLFGRPIRYYLEAQFIRTKCHFSNSPPSFYINGINLTVFNFINHAECMCSDNQKMELVMLYGKINTIKTWIVEDFGIPMTPDMCNEITKDDMVAHFEIGLFSSIEIRRKDNHIRIATYIDYSLSNIFGPCLVSYDLNSETIVEARYISAPHRGRYVSFDEFIEYGKLYMGAERIVFLTLRFG